MSTIDPAMFELFREEVRTHAQVLSTGLLAVELDPTNVSRIEPLMRGAHSIKGAARIVGIDVAVRLAHEMEDALVAAQSGKVVLNAADIDALLQGADILAGLSLLTPTTTIEWEAANRDAVTALEPIYQRLASGSRIAATSPSISPWPVVSGAREQSEPTSPRLSSIIGAFPEPPPYQQAIIPQQPAVLSNQPTMLDVFREELRANLLLVNHEDTPGAIGGLKQITGAAQIMKCRPIESLSRAIGSYLQAVRESGSSVTGHPNSWLDCAVSVLAGAIETDDDSFQPWLEAILPTIDTLTTHFSQGKPEPSATPPTNLRSTTAQSVSAIDRTPPLPQRPSSTIPKSEPEQAKQPAILASIAKPRADTATSGVTPQPEAVVRVTAQSLNRLMGLAGESLVQARWLPSFATALLVLKNQHDQLALILERTHHEAVTTPGAEDLATLLSEVRRQARNCRNGLLEKANHFDDHAARAEDLNTRLYREVIVCRMRPFRDGVHGFPRLVRDMARTLGKEAQLHVEGEQTEVDRDILEKLESPLSHLIRNGVDHGLETATERATTGKHPVGTIRLEARHRAGMLLVTITDDGRGVDLEKLRRKVVERGMNTAEVASRMTEAELLEFLFLPGFTTTTHVTEFSGRGVGLDVVQDTIRKVGGSVRITTQLGQGTTFHLQLPLTLSVIRAVVVTISGEAYAFPHTRIDRLIRLPRTGVHSLEHRQFVTVDGQNVGLVLAAQLLDLPTALSKENDLAVVLLSDATGSYGLVVDSFLGEQDLVVRPLDTRLGKVPNLSAAAILDDGSPVLILDAEDLVRSMDQFIQTGSLSRCEVRPQGKLSQKRVLIVDDSITVREVERQLLLHKGYHVTVAVDGIDGWNKVRSENFDLVVTDIDMPRMNGLQLVQAIRGEESLRRLPVMIVSYKEREEDRLRGLEVGANCYLTKSSFHDNRFIEAVEDLVGPAVEMP